MRMQVPLTVIFTGFATRSQHSFPCVLDEILSVQHIPFDLEIVIQSGHSNLILGLTQFFRYSLTVTPKYYTIDFEKQKHREVKCKKDKEWFNFLIKSSLWILRNGGNYFITYHFGF